ncbi:MAG: CBS domain-containing protein [Candidatus Binatia bacterium]
MKKKRTEKVRDYMTTSPLAISSEDSLQTVNELLGKHNIRQMPVVDHGRLIGIVTDRDRRIS